jgi:hypothetical protein
MTDNNTSTQTEQQPARPNPALKGLDKLVGTWNVSDPSGKGEINGRVSFEWMEGGFFFVQHFDLDHNGHKARGIEIIGYGRDWEGTVSRDCTSRLFDNDGNAFAYTWDVDDDTLTIWGGERGAPANFKGKFSDDRNTLTGRWEWPGGGYQATMTRVKSK